MLQYYYCRTAKAVRQSFASVAQLDRALDSDSEGRRFDSCQAHHKAEPTLSVSCSYGKGYFFVRPHKNLLRRLKNLLYDVIIFLLSESNRRILQNMRKIKRYKNQRRVIILRGIKYLLIITVLLLALAFVLTTFVFKGNDDDSGEASDTSAASETQPAETEPEEDENIDNSWAMFLVNKKNPLPKNYDNMIETKVVFESWREYYLDVRAADYIERMIDAAKEDGVDLLVVSAYRTIEYQQQNFDKSVQDRVDRGMSYDDAYADTLAEVALPGESEHNAGLALDIMCEEYQSMDDDGFENTDAFKWLDKHAAEYGFILRYPKGKQDITGIIYEPWHYRFVGLYYAGEIKKSGLCLEEYYESRGWVDEDGKATKMRGPYDEIEKQETAVTTTAADTKPKETMPSIPYSEQKVTIIV